MSASARLTRKSGTSFYYAFRLLPAPKRRAIFALYSLCRVLDDCVDEAGGEGEAGLVRWQAEVDRCYAGRPTTELGRDLAECLLQYPIPRRCLEDIVAGCRMDLTTRRYSTFADLRLYCERVASAVGLASIEIFGYVNPATRDYAVELGLALQLTNILRDVAVDLARDRLYIPLEDLERFHVSELELQVAVSAGGKIPTGMKELLSYQAERAEDHHQRSRALLPPEDRRSMLAAEMMGAVYGALREEIVRRDFPLTPPVALSRSRKAFIALRTVPRVYWGL